MRAIAMTVLLAGCQPAQVHFPPDLWVWDSGGWDTGLEPPDTASPTDTAEPPPVPTPPAPTGPLGSVDTARYVCTPANDAWLVEVTTAGWAGTASASVRTSTGDLETHPLVLIDSDPSGGWDRYQAGPMAAGATAEPGVSSAVACGTDGLSFGVVTRGRVGQLVDCRVWGADPTGLADAMAAAVSDLTAADCTPL